jgi:hypothetical protein
MHMIAALVCFDCEYKNASQWLWCATPGTMRSSCPCVRRVSNLALRQARATPRVNKAGAKAKTRGLLHRAAEALPNTHTHVTFEDAREQ